MVGWGACKAIRWLANIICSILSGPGGFELADPKPQADMLQIEPSCESNVLTKKCAN